MFKIKSPREISYSILVLTAHRYLTGYLTHFTYRICIPKKIYASKFHERIIIITTAVSLETAIDIFKQRMCKKKNNVRVSKTTGHMIYLTRKGNLELESH